MKNLKIGKNVLKENFQASKHYVPSGNGKKINFENFLRNEYKVESAKYPFLSKTQIKQRVIDMWKKQHASQSKLNSRKFENKSDKTVLQKSTEKGNYKSKNDTLPKRRSKKDLVPLKIDFIPTGEGGILKRNSYSNGDKRRVSFNKRLYIRYRTTSEESSCSTFKDKKNIKEKRKPLVILSNNNPETYEPYDFNTSAQNYKKSKLDQKFDELLNKKCSWTYKSQNGTQIKNMDIQEENLQPMQTTLEVQITQDKCQKALGDMSSRIDAINYSNNVPAKENINEWANSTLQDRNSPQMKTYSNINRILKTKVKNINVKLSTSESDKTKTTRISMNETIESSSSSDEVLQTRYSVNNKNILQTDEFYSNDCSPTFMGSTSDKESILENDLNKKTSPIIIQATAHGEDKGFNDSHCNKMSDEKQQEIISMNKTNAGIKNRYSLNFATNYSDDTESNSIQSSNENRDEKFDIKVASDNIVEDFLNGSFDISTYQLNKPSLVEQSGKQCITMMQANTENIQGRNSYGKRITNELVPISKKNKFSNSSFSKKEPFHNSTETFTRYTNKKRSGIKKAKTVPKPSRRTKKSTESVDKLHKEKVNLKAKRIQKSNKRKDTLYNKEQDLMLKKGICSSKKSNSLTRYPRSLRNSSLVASKKIREIEQMENQSDFCEEINIYSNDETNHTSKHCEYNNSNNIQTGQAHESKVKHDMKNTVKNRVQSENGSEENEEANSIFSYFSEEELKNITLTSYKKTLFQNPYKAFDQSENLSKRDSLKRNFIPDLSSFDQYFQPDINSDLSENLKNSFKDKTKVYKSLEDNSYFTANKTKQTNSKIVSSFNKTIKESNHKTWESLERELLKDLDEMHHVDNICKTVILQEEEVIRKKEVENDTNLFTVSDTSMLQTVKKSITKKKYNMHYEVKNVESKVFRSTAEPPHEFQNRIRAPCSNETVPSKSICILDKTLAAMEKCTVNFISPQVEIFDYGQKESSFQFEDAADNSDANHETQFHKSVTFMTKNNKQYYSNEIIGYMKKSKVDSKKNYFKQSNMTTVLKDLSDQTKEHKDRGYRYSKDAGYSKQSTSVSGNYLHETYPKRLCEEKSQALFPYSGGEDNPWSTLMKKLDAEYNYEEDNNEHSISDSGQTCKSDENVKKQFMAERNLNQSLNDEQINESFVTEINLKQGLNDTDKQIKESFMTESNLKYSLKDINYKDKILIPVEEDEIMKIHEEIKKQDLKHMVHTTFEPLVLGSKSNNSGDRSNLCEIESSNVTEKKNNDDNKCEKSQELESLKETEIKKKHVLKQCETPLKRSLKYKLRIDRDGSVKIKHSNEISSVSESSQDFVESKKISEADLKKCKQRDIPNNTREKYTKYLKHKLDEQALLFTKDNKNDGRSKSENGLPQNISKESQVFSKENPNEGRVKLIAENEDDIFSLSSSDSETSSKKNPGTGLLCDLFDE